MPTLRCPALAVVLAAALSGSASACAAAPASVAGMTFAATTPKAGAQAVLKVGDVEGGRPTLALGYSQVSNENLRAALEASLRSHGLLCSSAEAPFTLRTVLADMQQELAGLDLPVTAYVHYTITDSQGATVFDDRITTEATGTFHDAFAAIKRVRIAAERSMRANIEALLRALSAARLPSAPCPSP